MENNQKIETLLRAALNATPEERRSSADLAIGYSSEESLWEVIVRYSGDLDSILSSYPDIRATELLGQYALLRVPEERIDAIAAEEGITYIEKPKQLFYETLEGRRSSCISSLQNRLPSLTGKGTLIAIIDSGIDYRHPDFQTDDGRTRILALWDQTLPSGSVPMAEAPSGYGFGTLFSAEMINSALAASDLETGYRLCPSTDASGHGTIVAGIAAGNGRASDGIYRGVAPEADLLIVKLGIPGPKDLPSTSLLMAGVDFCMRLCLSLRRPLAINLSFGNTYGSHSGTSLLETYLDLVSTLGQTTIVVGSGNEGASGGHTGGTLDRDRSESVQFGIGEYTPALSLSLWKNFRDDFRLSIQAPSGRSILLPEEFGIFRYDFGETLLYSYNGAPTPYSPFQEIYLDLLAKNTYLSSGLWTIRLLPQDIRSGRWDIWMPGGALRNPLTAFLRPTAETTLTIPSTAARVITVGAYDPRENTIAAFSGRGYTRNDERIKPDLVAPGVNITSCAIGGGYETRSGTSMAAPFVSGSAALLMQWGILEGNDPFLYGEKMRACLIRGAGDLPGFSSYPNPETGWGRLCTLQSLF